MTKHYLLRKLVALVAPDGMSFEEYSIRCATSGVEVSLDNKQYVYWLFSGTIDPKSNAELDSDQLCKVKKYLLKAIEEGYVFDAADAEDNSFFASYAVDALLADKSFAEDFFRLMLTKHRHTEAGDAIYKLNKGFGITSMCYFEDGKDGLDFKDILG